MRAIFESLGAKLNWDSAKKKYKPAWTMMKSY